ncbi:MAG: hypothetical protein R3F41_03600 [Gammaproteobacteria bacterium]|nr:hypothetical protein [Pseudomonadales bacterium]MCP5345623.1 hypothetical protein [Pseudomonadales bacterium]
MAAERYYYDVFGSIMRVERQDGEWALFRVSADGKSARVYDIVIPAGLTAAELESYLDDMFHESAGPLHSAVTRLR